MTVGVLTFTNLFPNSVMPTHGVFVWDRMHRVVDELDAMWQVVSPAPNVWRPLRRNAYAQWAELPLVEDRDGVVLHHPPYRHWPGFSLLRQPERMARAALPVVRQITSGGRWLIDAHYLYPDGVAAAAVARELGLPYTLAARGTDVNVLAQNPRIAQRIREAAAGAVACIAVSRPLAQAFETVVDREVEVIRNGVDLDRFQPGDVQQARERLGLPSDGALALGVGRLVHNKGFIDAVSGLGTPGLEHVRLVLVGDGPEREALRAAGGDRVILLGNRSPEDVALAYQACDLMVLPTHREGWPNVVTEALASGLPVVAYGVGGIPDILAGDRVAGEAVDPQDSTRLHAAMVERLRKAPDRAKVRSFATRYSWGEPVSRTAELFRSALDSR